MLRSDDEAAIREEISIALRRTRQSSLGNEIPHMEDLAFASDWGHSLRWWAMGDRFQSGHLIQWLNLIDDFIPTNAPFSDQLDMGEALDVTELSLMTGEISQTSHQWSYVGDFGRRNSISSVLGRRFGCPGCGRPGFIRNGVPSMLMK